MSSRRKQSKPKAAFETTADENNKTENSSLVANNADTVTSISKPEEVVVNNNVAVVEEQNGGSGETEATNDDAIKEPVQEQTSEVVDNEPMINSDAFEANNRKRKREDESADIENKIEDKRATNYTELEYIGGGKETEDSNEDEESGENSNPSSTGGGRNEGGVDLDALDDEDQGVGEEEDILGEETGMYEDEDEMGLMDDDMMANMTASGDLYSNSSPSRRVGGPGAANFSSLDQNASLLLVFKCKVCGKGFKHRRSLNRHVKLHSGEKNFKCPYCSTAFARSDHLKAHIRTHNNMKPYRCSVCHCGYSTQAALKVHIAHHHSKSKFRCVLCNNLEFHSQLALEGHIYTKHSKENKTNIDELINETATINPEIVNVEEATNYNLINQRTRLIEINNYTNLNKSGGSQNGGSNSNLNGSIVQQNGVNNSNGVNVRYSPSDSSIHHHNNHHAESKSNRNGNNYYDDEEAIHTNNSNEENDANSIYGTENGHYQNGVVKPEDYDEDKNDDLIIEEEVRPSPGQRPIAPRGGYNPHMAVNRGPIVPPASTQANTYCELCNARFSSVESYAAHMRNCHPTASVHPSITPTIRGASQPPIASPITDNKMPYLTSILSTPSNNLPLNKNGPIVNKTPQQTQAAALSLAHHSSSNSSIHSSQQLSPALNNSCSINPASTAPGIINRGLCTVPGCNCASSKDALRQYNSPPPSQHTDNYVHKDTHYTCVQCNLSGLNNTAYMAHIKSTHCVEVYRCILCKQMQLFDNLTLLKEHFFLVHAAHKYDVIKCNVCPPASSVTFANVDELGHHVKAIHRPPVPPPFHNGHHLPPTAIPPHHLPSSQPPPPPPVSQQPTSHHHLINNDRFKCYKCQYCDSDFTQPNALQQHIQIVHPNQYHNHHQPQQQQHQPATFSCQYCRNTFSNRGQLERHMRMHLTTVDLKCNICDRTFENEELLSEHKLTHSKTLTTNTNNINMSESPSSTQISSCAFCKQPIETDQQFKEHFKRHNNIGQPNQAPGNRFMCPVCRQMLTSNSEYGIHVRSHVKRNTANSPSQSQPANKELKNGPLKLENGSAEENGIYIKVAPAPANSNPAIIKDELSSTQIPSAQIPLPVNSQKPADFLCEICSSKFETNTKLQAHLLLKHEHQNQQQNGVFICPVCDEQFNRPDVLLFHTSVHGQAAKIYKCSQCPQSYVFKSQLINHSFSHHSQSHHQRNGAAPIMSSQSNRVMPAQSQQGPNGYNLRSHSTSPVKQTPPPPTQIQPIPGDNNQVFGVAGAQYTVNSNGTHKTYTCLTCSKTFANQRNLNVHLRIHTGFRPFECDVCKHKFTRRENLRSHMKCHLNLRPFTCPICTRSFRRRSHVTSHIEVHFKSKVHNCVECSVQFDRLEAYLKHLITEHSAHDRELIALIRSRNILDLSQFDIPENPPNNPNNNGANSITIQSLIDDQDQQSYENDDEYAENGGVASVEEEEEVNNDDPGLEEDEPNEYIDDPATEHNFENYGGDDNEEIDFTD